jgi:MYXO-CTERM domain-containing protein
MLPAILAALVGLVVLTPGPGALGHERPAVERAALSPAGPLRTGSPDARDVESRLPAEDRAEPDRSRNGREATGLASSEAAGGAVWLAVALIGLAAAARWRRRGAATLTALALVVLAFETGLHSVHHLGDEAAASHCTVASASSQLAGTTEEGPALRIPVLAAGPRQAFEIAPVALAPFRCEATRGPPAPLTA